MGAGARARFHARCHKAARFQRLVHRKNLFKTQEVWLEADTQVDFGVWFSAKLKSPTKAKKKPTPKSLIRFVLDTLRPHSLVYADANGHPDKFSLPLKWG